MTFTIPSDVRARNSRVFAWKIGDENVYVKQDTEEKHTNLHLAQSMLFRISRNPLLKRSVLQKGDNPVLFEAGKLKQLRENGINVPTVLHMEPAYFVMSETGNTLMQLMECDDTITDQEIEGYVCQALGTLKKLHDKGFAHGAAQIRNFTIKNGCIYLIDFEEKITAKHLEAFQMRDLILFMLSLEKGRFSPDVRAICACYEGPDGDGNGTRTMGAVYAALKGLSWLRILKSPFFRKIRMSDVRALISLFEKLETAVQQTHPAAPGPLARRRQKLH